MAIPGKWVCGQHGSVQPASWLHLPGAGRLGEVLQHGHASDAVLSVLDGVHECGARVQIKWLVYSS